ncbi:MAG: hypothetical protein R3F49_10025 [Planctomycetota bacterium]
MLRTLAAVSLGLATLSLARSVHADGTNAGIDHAPGVAGWVPATPKDGVFSDPAIGSPVCEDRITLSPVLMYSSAGGTLLGLQMDQVTVYSSGLVLLASAESHSGSMSARMAQVSPLEVLRLGRELARLGASSMCDQIYDVSDVPLKTISVASAIGPDVRLHSFSYWLATDQHAIVESAIEQWMLDNGLIGSTRE